MPSKPAEFWVHVRLETRVLNVSGDLKVFAATGKGKDSGWSALRKSLEDLGFRFEAGLDSPLYKG